MTINDYMAVPEERRAVCRSSLEAMTPYGPYNNEYVWFFYFNESGDQVVRITEFLDSKAAADILAKVKAGREASD